MQRKAFIILTTQRSGSTYLRLWLNNHPDIRCHDELFLPNHNGSESFSSFLKSRFWARSAHKEFLARQAPKAFLYHHYLKSYVGSILSDSPHALPSNSHHPSKDAAPTGYQCEAKWVGWKQMDNHLRALPKLEMLLIERNTHVIILRREKLLDIYASRKVAEHRKVYHSENSASLADLKIKLDTKHLIKHLAGITNGLKIAKEKLAGLPSVSISYEELTAPDTKMQTIKRCFDFLELDDSAASEPSLIKQVDKPVADIIENYEEVVQALKLNGYDADGRVIES
ncbi:sulfotransferase [Cerasicoccus maritimus]|uniref:sulfotransferase n=1 Tax=Cerasicoccus maritimus TaxID=490089 RepID=UPI002852AB9A|nr:sulfotransferase [Cerasicoccus maritimus]